MGLRDGAAARAVLLDTWRRRADAPALEVEDGDTRRWISWSAMLDAAQAPAAGLRALGVRRVAVSGAGAEAYAEGLAVALLADATLVPLHPRLTGVEAARQLAQVAPVARRMEDRWQVEGGAEPVWTSNPPLVVMFTSGTTGESKGAMLGAEALLAAAVASAQRLGSGPDDVWLAAMPMAHIGGLSVLVRAVVDGARVVAMSRFDADAVGALLASRGVTRLPVVPTMLARLLEAGVAPPPSLQTVLVGGAACDPALLLRARAAGWPAVTTYGLTEACAQVCTATPEMAEEAPGSVGTPLPGVRVEVRHAGLDGVGEVAVAGPTLMRGYWGRPGTAPELSDGWFATGDLGRLDGAGRLWVVSRRTDLIVTGGENVYPAEVEAALLTVAGVRDACVVGVDDPLWGQRVGALVVWDGVAPAPGGAALGDVLRDRLAGYKIPRLWRECPEIPRNAMGKPDRVAARSLLLGSDQPGRPATVPT